MSKRHNNYHGKSAKQRGNAPQNNLAEKSADKKPKKRAYAVQPVYQVIRLARNQFKRQVEKNGEVKKKCLNIAVGRRNDIYPDSLRFELDYRKERDRLLDSNRFKNECNELSMSAEYVADHIVFEGKSMVNNVLFNGISVLGEHIRMFNTPILVDSQQLYEPAKAEEITNE